MAVEVRDIVVVFKMLCSSSEAVVVVVVGLLAGSSDVRVVVVVIGIGFIIVLNDVFYMVFFMIL